MLNSIFAGTITIGPLAITVGCAIVLGVLSAFLYARKNRCDHSFAVTLAVLPLIASIVIIVVNGHLGAGIAVAGAFSLVRFRSAQGSAKEILAIFLSAALGLCLGAGYAALAGILFALYAMMIFLLDLLPLGEVAAQQKELKITVPESLHYEGLFDEVLDTYTSRRELINVKTAEMGSIYRLTYHVALKSAADCQQMMDSLRVRNGNLPISLGMIPQEGRGL